MGGGGGKYNEYWVIVWLCDKIKIYLNILFEIVMIVIVRNRRKYIKIYIL